MENQDKTNFNVVSEKAMKGDSEAQCDLGILFSKGKGVEADEYKAFEWFKKSAEQGNARGQFQLGWCYEMEYGVAEDYEKAIEWYEKSANQGFSEAEYQLGMAYRRGEIVDTDEEKAFAYFLKAGEHGNAKAQDKLAFYYYEGEVVDKDIEKAIYWWKTAAEQGYATAQYNLAFSYKEGDGVPQDYKTAAKWYKMAGRQGYGDAWWQLAKMKEKGQLDEPILNKESGKVGDYAYVDLGLSVMWATCNVGANEPQELGDYYAWGETKTKEEYSKKTFVASIEKYADCTKKNQRNLFPKDDAATVNMGNDWRMATAEEMQELIDGCYWYVDSNYKGSGVAGYVGVSKKNENTIFFPAAGANEDSMGEWGINECLYSWSSSPVCKDSDAQIVTDLLDNHKKVPNMFNVYYLFFDEEGIELSNGEPVRGTVIRAVVKKDISIPKPTAKKPF